ncbi:MAG: ATPase, T2SS/T4P/T4SS family [Schleiferilactobacillus perolens]|uniref:ATPase, T2SS/T4P/T4SS family n=1 Tax=Schleiferilactobacillus perolens TaxID=100468 RepID=UPI0039E9AACD|nr:Flp pilus assembly complex ATPase component TadA [Schleiferilactobacillus harbinensis]MCI1911845.1 Flp pilus assembly complex ATPase component TadA [Schleiferilactobacillus harbinensis]
MEVAKDLIAPAINARVSDIYIRPVTQGYAVVWRQAGDLVTASRLSQYSGQQVINALKYLAALDVSETRRPQSGMWRYNPQVNIRVATVGDYLERESGVLRILYPLASQPNLFFPSQFDTLCRLAQQRGLIAFAGPMGSGKTTLMYHVAAQLARQGMVMAIEDPVEIAHPAIKQIQVNDTAQMSYPVLLKAALRERPDLLIIGEVRDAATAQLAFEAALSGHSVFTTIHARTTGGIVGRLRQMGLPEAVLANSLSALIYQRLIPQSTGPPALLCDIGAQDTLTKLISTPQQCFVAWQQSLRYLYEHGRIAGETAARFQYG